MSVSVEEKVMKLVSEATKTDLGKVALETSFIDDLNLDSLDRVELMMAVEDEFEVEVSDEEAENIKTVNDLVKYLNK